jgi:hypothetical protein
MAAFLPAIAPIHVSGISGNDVPGQVANHPPDLVQQIYAGEIGVGHKQCCSLSMQQATCTKSELLLLLSVLLLHEA